VVDEFQVPTADSQPTGIDAVLGSPTRVWFTERVGNKLGQLVVTGTASYTFTEYSIPASFPNAQPQDLYVETSDSIWFTAPGVNSFGNLKPSYWPWNPQAFVLRNAGGGSQPWAIAVDTGGYPWFTEPVGNRIGQFFPQTISFINWYTLTVAGSDPYDLAVAQGLIWFTERNGNRAGQLRPGIRTVREYGLPAASVPLGLAVDGTGCVWIADSGTNKIVSWCPPYFRSVYLPLALRNS
jgi:hypothetical protein